MRIQQYKRTIKILIFSICSFVLLGFYTPVTKGVPYVIGIVGYSGSGKTEFSDVLSKARADIFVCHLDEIAFEIIYEHRQYFIDTFGAEVFKTDGTFNYDYYCKCEKSKIEECSKWRTPLIDRKIYELLTRIDPKYKIVLIDYISLPKTDIWKSCYKKVFIDSDEDQRHKHLEKRTYMPCNIHEAIIRDKKMEPVYNSIKDECIVIYNDYTKNFHRSIFAFLEKLLKDICII